MTTIEFQYKEPNKEESFSYKMYSNGQANIYNIANPKKYLKSDFVKYSYFTLPNQQKTPMCSKKSLGNSKQNCKKVPKPSQSKFLSKISIVKATDSLISRTLGKDNNLMNHYYILGSLKNVIDILGKSFGIENKTIPDNIKFEKYNYRKNTQKGGIDLVISGTLIIILIIILCISSTNLCILYLLLQGGGGKTNSKNDISSQIIREIGGKKYAEELKNKIINSSFFPIGNDYYIYVKFSKNNFFQTMVEVPFIVKLTNTKDTQNFVNLYSKKTQKITQYIQQRLNEELSTSQPQAPQGSFFRRMRNRAVGKVKNRVTSGISKKIEKFNQKLQEMEKEYNQDETQSPQPVSFF